jgi:hypothetical protein
MKQQQQQQQQQQGQLRTPTSKILLSSQSSSNHKQRRLAERSAEVEAGGDGQAASAEKRPRTFVGGGGFLPPAKMKQGQEQRLRSIDIAPPSNPFYPQHQQPASAEAQTNSRKQPPSQPQTRQGPPPQQQAQRHHPRMALDMSISKKLNRGAVADGGRRVVIMPSPAAAAASLPGHSAAPAANGRGRGGAARGFYSSGRGKA